MIDCGKPASNQMQLDGLWCEGEEEMREARMWVGTHFSDWCRYKEIAREQSSEGYASPNFVLQSMRHRCRVSVKNALAPYLARIAMEEDPSIRFRTARSRADGFTTVQL